MSIQLALMATLLTTAALSLSPMSAHAQSLDDNSGPIEINDSNNNYGRVPGSDRVAEAAEPAQQPQVGRKAAAKYMGVKKSESRDTEEAGNEYGRRAPASSSSAHYMAIHFGSFLSDNAYQWGSPSHQTNVGNWNLGVTYRIGEWVNSMDLGVRVDAQSYGLNEGRATKLSFLPVVTFPDASSKFPIYFGAGAGFGVFVQQLTGKSVLSIDYQLFGGIRFFNVLQNTGFFAEAGIKNHFLILSDGQFNGTFAALGCVFTF